MMLNLNRALCSWQRLQEFSHSLCSGKQLPVKNQPSQMARHRRLADAPVFTYGKVSLGFIRDQPNPLPHWPSRTKCLETEHWLNPSPFLTSLAFRLLSAWDSDSPYLWVLLDGVKTNHSLICCPVCHPFIPLPHTRLFLALSPSLIKALLPNS